MATSGNTSWELNRNEIIEACYRKLGVLAQGQSASTEQLTHATQALNSLIVLFKTDGMPLWKRTEVSVTLVDGTSTYTISNAVKVAQVVLVATEGSTQYELQNVSLYDFNRLPQGDETEGTPVHYTYQPKIQDGTLRVWPTPDSGAATNYTLKVVIQKEFDGFISSTDTPDFPPYWTDALIYGLAVRMAPENGVPLEDRQFLRTEAKEYFDAASDYGDEDGSLYKPSDCDIPDQAD
jgi:hypothetical protein